MTTTTAMTTTVMTTATEMTKAMTMAVTMAMATSMATQSETKRCFAPKPPFEYLQLDADVGGVKLSGDEQQTTTAMTTLTMREWRPRRRQTQGMIMAVRPLHPEY